MLNRRSLLLGASAAAAAFVPVTLRAQQAVAAQITGAGASFPNPVYQKWGEAAREAIDVQLNYQSVGSGAGINQIRNRTVDFGASDAPLSVDQLQEHKLLQFPTVMGAVVAIVNVPGVADNQLRLTGDLLAEIYLGKVTRWNDPKIVAMNREVQLPSLAIAPAYRADGSGTTFVFTSYLSGVSSEFKDRVGAGTSVRWPAGTGARGNEGVAGTVRNTRGAIGYVENAYATQNRLAATQLRNKADQFVRPTMESFVAAAASADWDVPGLAPSLLDQQGATTWPIVSPTYILLPTNPQDPARSRAVMRFFDWAYRNGDQIATQLEYVPIPDSATAAVRRAWAEQVKGPDGRPAWTQG
jgi:phosphate transport system substrate-binding protein